MRLRDVVPMRWLAAGPAIGLLALAGCGGRHVKPPVEEIGAAEVRAWLDRVREAGPDDPADDAAEVLSSAADAIDAAGPAAVSPLAAALRDDPVWHVREFAAFALGRQGRHAVPAVPALLRGLRDDNFLVTEACDGALGTIADTGPAGLAAVTDGLASDDPAIRAAVAELLGAVGPAASAALPRLERVADEDTDAAVRSAAREAATAIDRGH